MGGKTVNYWLIKSEGACYSIDDLRKDRTTAWTGVRNFQARNFIRDMQVGDGVLFYHSNGTPSQPNGIYGLARVTNAAYPDATAKDKKDEHYEPRNDWVCADMAFVRRFDEPVTLDEIKIDPALAGMLVAKRGTRLSVMPVSEKHFNHIEKLGKSKKYGESAKNSME